MDSGIRIIIPEEVAQLNLWEGQVISRRLVTHKKDGSSRMSFHVNSHKPGLEISGVVYPDKDEINYVTEGEMVVAFDGKSLRLVSGMAMYVPAGKEYAVKIGEDGCVLISVFSPPRE